MYGLAVTPRWLVVLHSRFAMVSALAINNWVKAGKTKIQDTPGIQ